MDGKGAKDAHMADDNIADIR